MRKQAYPVAQLTGGLDVSVDATFLVDKASPNLQNVRFSQGLIRKGLGFTQFGTSSDLNLNERDWTLWGPNPYANDLAWNGTNFLAACSATRGAITDGLALTWITANMPSIVAPNGYQVTWSRLCWNSVLSRWVAIGTDPYYAYVYSCYSSDGITWTQGNSPPTWPSGYSPVELITNGSIFILFVGYWRLSVLVNIYYTSTDGVTWTKRTLTGAQRFQECAWNGTVFCVMDRLAGCAWTSSDGTTWTQRTMPSSATWCLIAWNGTIFCAVDYNTTKAATSADGITWVARTLPTGAQFWSDIEWCSGLSRWLLAGANGANPGIWLVSADAITWTQHNFPAGWTQTDKVAASSSRFVIVPYGPLKYMVSDTALTVGLPLVGTPLLIDTFPTIAGSEYLVVATTKFVYKYISADKSYVKKNETVTTGSLAMTFVAATKKITRGANSFITNGFTVGTIITTDATLNPGPFTATVVAALEITVAEAVVDEGPVTKTATGQAAFTGDEDYKFCSAVILDHAGKDIFILTNGLDSIKKWEVGSEGSGEFVALEGLTTIKAKQVMPFKSRLLLGFTTESGTNCPWRVRWSKVADPETWTGTGTGFVDLADTSDWIVALVTLKSKVYVIKERSIWELVYVGGTTVFTPELRIGGVGTYAPNSVVNLGEEIILYGTDNIYLYDGIDLTPIGDQIYPLIYDTEKKIVSTTKSNRVPSTYIEELKEYWLCLTKEGPTPNLWFSYNFGYKSWARRDKEVTVFGYESMAEGAAWNELTGTWANQTWIWMEKALPAGAPTTLLGTPDGYIWEDTRKTKSIDYMCFETKDWMFGHAQRWTEFRIQARGGPFEVCYSLDEGHVWSNPKTLPYTDPLGEFKEHVLNVNRTSQKLRAKITCVAEDLDIKWIEPWYISRKRSKSIVTS